MSLSITSKQNPKFKALLGLTKSSTRRETGLALVEGYRCISRAIAGGYCCNTLMVRDGYRGPTPEAKQSYTLSDELIDRLVYRKGNSEMVASVEFAPDASELVELIASPRRVVILDNIEKPGNVGAILRSADATGVDTVISTAGGTDWANPNLIRSSTGACFALALAQAPVGIIIEAIESNGRSAVILDPRGADWTPGTIAPTEILIFGSEAHGLDPAWSKLQPRTIALPMRGVSDSLNVAQCATVLLYDQMMHA